MAKNSRRARFLLLWFMLWPLLFWFFWTPIPFTYLKLATLLVIGLLWMGTMLMPCARWLGAVFLLAVVGVGLWPPQNIDSGQLARAYVGLMFQYRDTPYVWGGENGRGIDCSGLVRRGFIDALISEGWKTRNLSLWREAATVWWRDCSAREMKNGYGGRIVQRFEARRLNDLDTTQLQIGDLAVMGSGVHVLAFIGDRSWIQADPNLVNGGDKVIVTEAPSKSGWFGQGVVICRWKMLDSKSRY